MFLLYLNIRQLFSRYDKRLINVNESRIRTAYGAVHGKVFVDYNGNLRPDVDEPGVPNVKVHLGQSLSVLTDERGYYILSVPPNASEVRVHLAPSTVPATYTVANGTQVGRVYRDSLTEINLSLTPLISVVGRVVAADPNASEPNAPGRNLSDPNAPELSPMIVDAVDANDLTAGDHPLAGVHVTLHDARSGLLVADSYTAADGSYYLGDIKPGRYKLGVDLPTLPNTHVLTEPERILVIEPTREEFLEIEQPDFTATVPTEAKPPDVDDASANGQDHKQAG